MGQQKGDVIRSILIPKPGIKKPRRREDAKLKKKPASNNGKKKPTKKSDKSKKEKSSTKNEAIILASQTFWIGPYGILVNSNMDCVEAPDGGNTLTRDGQATQRNIPEKYFLTKEKYLKKHGIRGPYGLFIYKE
jgi:hypothetical protein